MSITVSSTQKEVIINTNSPFIHQEKDNEIKLLPLFHHHHQSNNCSIIGIVGDGSEVEEEEEDTTTDDDEYDDNNEIKVQPTSIKRVQKQPLLSSSLSSTPTIIQTYSPQLNLFSLYSSPIPSIKNKDLLSTTAVTDTTTAGAAPVQSKTTTNIYNQQNKPTISTIKMGIRSPPQPSQSTSRFKNAFQRFSRATSPQHNSSNNSRNQNVVTPAEIISMKPSKSGSSLADKIKNKLFHHQKRSSRLAATNNKPPTEEKTFSMPRSASLSSVTRLVGDSNKSTAAIKLSHSLSVTSFSSVSSSEATNTPLPSSFSLTKSISSHRLYTKTTSNNNTRPRQPLRAVNPNDSIRLSTNKKKTQGGGVQFTKLVSIKETYSKLDYDRGSDPEAICTRLTPTMAQKIKEELNAYKLHEMQVHEFSRVNTHFFL